MLNIPDRLCLFPDYYKELVYLSLSPTRQLTKVPGRFADDTTKLERARPRAGTWEEWKADFLKHACLRLSVLGHGIESLRSVILSA